MAGSRILPKADVQTLLAILLTALVAYLQIAQGSVPDNIGVVWGMAMGFYFASKENGAERRHLEQMVWDARFIDRRQE